MNGRKTPAAAMNATKTYQYVGAQTGVYFGRRVVLSSLLHLFVDEAAVSRGVVFTQVVQHGPELVQLPQSIPAASRRHLQVTISP